MRKEKGRILEFFLYIFSVSILIIFVYSIVLYRDVFGGALSKSSDDWSNFGGFFGSSFGALISFATLIAIIITIQFQRRLLEHQMTEYQRLFSLQKISLDAQLEQLTLSKNSAEKEATERARQTILTLLSQKIQIEVEHSAISQNVISTLLSQNVQPDNPHLLNAKSQRDLSLSKRDKLSGLFFRIAVKDYQSTEDLRNYFSQQYSTLNSSTTEPA